MEERSMKEVLNERTKYEVSIEWTNEVFGGTKYSMDERSIEWKNEVLNGANGGIKVLTYFSYIRYFM